jgi:hypothetical protein
MSDEADNVATMQLRLPSLRSRVHRKREVLQQWLDKGIPHEKLASLPRSLTEARKWNDPSLGVYPIGSPNNFTTVHSDVGEDVEAISVLLTKLQEKLKRPAARKRSTPQKPAISVKDIEQAMSALISQWHMAREEARKQRVRAELAERHRDLAREELRAKEAENAELRRRLSDRLTVIQ